jgi:hypothetical protein
MLADISKVFFLEAAIWKFVPQYAFRSLDCSGHRSRGAVNV